MAMLMAAESRFGFGSSNAADFGQKKARSLPTGPWKFWERMPERQVLYDPNRHIVQVRSKNLGLQKHQSLLRN
jgi:hypothetical protein